MVCGGSEAYDTEAQATVWPSGRGTVVRDGTRPHMSVAVPHSSPFRMQDTADSRTESAGNPLP